MRFLCSLLLLVATALPAVAQHHTLEKTDAQTLGGYLHQTAITPESYLITSPEELKSFVERLPPVLPYRTLPARPNPDPLLKGYEIDFEKQLLAIAVGRNRIDKPPVYQGIEELQDGSRRVHFTLSAPTPDAYPFGWAVYTAIILERRDTPTSVVVTTKALKRNKEFKRADFPRL